MANPFNCNLPGNLFVGYEPELLRIASGLGEHRNFAILGGQRCGKTSLLQRVAAQVAEAKSVIALDLDLDARVPHSAEEFFADLYSELVKGCTGAVAWTPNGVRQPYQTFLARVAEAVPLLEGRYGADWLAVVLIDNFNRAAAIPDVYANLRNLLSVDGLRRHFRLVCTGVPGELVTAGSPLANILDSVWLRRLDIDEAHSLLANMDAVENDKEILVLTGGQPFVLQGLLEQYWEKRDLSFGKRQFLKMRGAGLFRKWLETFGAEGRAVYAAIAQGGGRASLKDIRSRAKVADFDGAVRLLSFHGVVDDSAEDNIPRIAGTIFRDWFADSVERPKKRFAVAFSFAGETREKFVEPIAQAVAKKLTKDRVLYDDFHKGEFARPDLDLHLQRLYHDESELIVVVLCGAYEDKMWPGLEWKAIRDVMHDRNAESTMFLKTDDGDVKGVFRADGYLDLRKVSNDEAARLILDRVLGLQA